MKDSKVLIVTTAHDAEDGRLIRHMNALIRNGILAEILSIYTANRVNRFILGPLKAYLKIRRLKPDCVILPDPELQLFLPFILKNRTVVVVDVHEAYELVVEDRLWIRNWYRPFVKFFTSILVSARNRWADIVLIADASIGENVEVLVSNRPSPLDLPPLRSPDFPFRLVYVGDIRASRGLQEMLSLIEMTPEVHLDLIGPCEESENLLNAIEGRGLSKRITWHGRLPYRKSWEIASSSIAGLCLLRPTPAFVNAIPTKIWEYWAVGIPVLGSKLPAQTRLIEESGGGFVGEVEDLSLRVLTFIQNPMSARGIGEIGRRYYEIHDDGSEIRLVDAIQEVINKKNS